MSHEGIRIVRGEDARPDPPPLPRAAVTPLKVKVQKTEGTGVTVDWADGHHSSWNFVWLRNACPCATCHEAREAAGRLPGEPAPKPHTPFPQYEPPPRPVEVLPIGKYALKFKWTDGHESGIYSWEYLRRVCRCDICLSNLEAGRTSPETSSENTSALAASFPTRPK